MLKMEKKRSSFDYLFKIVLVGDLAVGKTCILLRFKEDTFNPCTKNTIGIDFVIKTFYAKNKQTIKA